MATMTFSTFASEVPFFHHGFEDGNNFADCVEGLFAVFEKELCVLVVLLLRLGLVLDLLDVNFLVLALAQVGGWLFLESLDFFALEFIWCLLFGLNSGSRLGSSTAKVCHIFHQLQVFTYSVSGPFQFQAVKVLFRKSFPGEWNVILNRLCVC